MASRAASGRRDGEERGWLRGSPPPRWVRMLPPALLVGVCAAGFASSQPLDIGFLLGTIPSLAVLSYGPVATALFGCAVVVLMNVPALQLNHPGNTDLLTISFIAVLSVFVSLVRSRRDAHLVTVRTVAEAAQLAVLPPLPERVGRVRCAGLYRAAQSGTLVGGDFFEVREGPYGVRAVMGDVQGHGLSAVGTVASLLGAFREAVLDQPELEAAAARLDRRLVVDSAGTEHAELFATALLLEFSPGADEVRLMSCGHPHPLLLRGAEAVELALEPGAPLGLGLLDVSTPKGRTVRLERGDRLFLASDGVTESRDKSGAFYPLAERLPKFDEETPAALIDSVWEDLVRFCTTVRDDVTMLVLTPLPEDAEGGPAGPGGHLG
ncbi:MULTISPECIES: PP2C family protein-serine/threonine phosphatase [unclassified Streptomyces]|uniref:PP2C family protein-serine/threonine phosphatase n=1 Tax=unclassified Streptomyces TaxID=2593676 RepID=UPI002E823098|nr:PP2C family protein-serine/threonine phosphatase [Streptomyces sp. NBC_00589]WTI41771.1 serine/threonine-protein phosphatase [Streptomyces sp. NBC_00775]WUB24546.1 serine/threonine-protein phosphatase [Streptomyces sp. NBC_00589]